MMFVACACLSATLCLAQETPRGKNSGNDSLKLFLQQVHGPAIDDEDKTSEYSVALVDLDGDGIKEAIVHVVGPHRCGTGGCNTLILRRNGSAWRVVTEISITREPIRVLATKSNGWSDLGVWVQGGGIQPGYEALLAFDGKTYPANPSVEPARELTTKVKGTVVLSRTSRKIPLYP